MASLEHRLRKLEDATATAANSEYSDPETGRFLESLSLDELRRLEMLHAEAGEDAYYAEASRLWELWEAREQSQSQ